MLLLSIVSASSASVEVLVGSLLEIVECQLTEGTVRVGGVGVDWVVDRSLVLLNWDLVLSGAGDIVVVALVSWWTSVTSDVVVLVLVLSVGVHLGVGHVDGLFGFRRG